MTAEFKAPTLAMQLLLSTPKYPVREHVTAPTVAPRLYAETMPSNAVLAPSHKVWSITNRRPSTSVPEHPTVPLEPVSLQAPISSLTTLTCALQSASASVMYATPLNVVQPNLPVVGVLVAVVVPVELTDVVRELEAVVVGEAVAEDVSDEVGEELGLVLMDEVTVVVRLEDAVVVCDVEGLVLVLGVVV